KTPFRAAQLGIFAKNSENTSRNTSWLNCYYFLKDFFSLCNKKESRPPQCDPPRSGFNLTGELSC
ncbi:MAG: hypothetical protein ACLVMC_09045, partial [[Clostridium] symbiosum]